MWEDEKLLFQEQYRFYRLYHYLMLQGNQRYQQQKQPVPGKKMLAIREWKK